MDASEPNSSPQNRRSAMFELERKRAMWSRQGVGRSVRVRARRLVTSSCKLRFAHADALLGNGILYGIAEGAKLIAGGLAESVPFAEVFPGPEVPIGLSLCYAPIPGRQGGERRFRQSCANCLRRVERPSCAQHAWPARRRRLQQPRTSSPAAAFPPSASPAAEQVPRSWRRRGG